MTNISNEQMRLIYLKIGENVKNARKEKSISQISLAYLIGFKSVSLISKAEVHLDNKHFNIKHLVQISTELNTNLADLFVVVKS